MLTAAGPNMSMLDVMDATMSHITIGPRGCEKALRPQFEKPV